MSDNDSAGSAWLVPPSRYIEGRPAEHAIPVPFSRYLPMRDGCRIAVDVYLPDGDRDTRRPVILIQTPYYRRFACDPAHGPAEPSPNIAKYRDMFVPRGYILVVADTRGSGASFGTRDSFRSPRERLDSAEIADWIVAQPWSDGTIGATGISYLGAASDFLASTGHPAVKAIAPLFSVWDTYLDNYYPGGVLITSLSRTYDDLMVGLDLDRRELLPRFAYYAHPAYRGPQPVDDDPDGIECRAAVQEHSGNFRMPEFMRDLSFRNEPLPYDPGFSSASISPSHYAEGISSDVAVYSVSGWMDGAGYANGAISRHLTLPNRNKYLLLGPWDHGARINVSPWRRREDPEFSIYAELVRFFDEHLRGIDTGLRREKPVHYFTLHEEAWHAADAWPVNRKSRALALSGDRTLAAASPAAGRNSVKADFSKGTGAFTRYGRIAAIDVREYYPDWQGRDAAMLSYNSAPLDAPLEITGHPVVSLTLASSEPDAVVHVYLSEVEPDGRVRYVTEGVLRALHRAEADAPSHYRTTWPFRSFSRAAAAPMPVDTAQTLRFGLLPVSWKFSKGSTIRLSIAGADGDHFMCLPHGRPPVLTVTSGPDGSLLELPVVEG